LRLEADAALLLIAPLHASAHADLTTIQPADGAQLGLAPGAVVLTFSEPLNANLSEATVTEATGRTVSAHPVAAARIQVDLVTNAPGPYRVTWVAVSRDDGHTVRGRTGFVVLSSAAIQAGATATNFSARDIAIAGGRYVTRTVDHRDPAVAMTDEVLGQQERRFARISAHDIGRDAADPVHRHPAALQQHGQCPAAGGVDRPGIE